MQLHRLPEEESVETDGHQPADPPAAPPEQPPADTPADTLPSPKRKWPVKPLVLGLIAAALLGTGITAYQIQRSAQPKKDIIAELTVPVEAQNLTVRIQASGNVRPVQSVNLSPKSQGRIAELLVEQGDTVQQGQIVARMESDEVQAGVQQAKAALAQAEARLEKQRSGSRAEEVAQAQARLEKAKATLAQLRAGSRLEDIGEASAGVARTQAQVTEAQSRLTLAETNVKRNRQLAAQGAIPTQEFDRAIDEAHRAKATLEQAQAGVAEAKQRLEKLQNGTRPEDIAGADASVAEAQSQLDEMLNGTRPEDIAEAEAAVAEARARVKLSEVQMEDTLVRAPFPGTIAQRYATVGAFVTPTTSASSAGSATSTSIVALARGLEVLAKVPEADISQIKPGQKVEIVADAYPDEVFKGRVHLIAPEAIKERDVTLFEVRVDIDTGLNKLQSGMNVDLTFLGNELKDALVVPTVAIVTQKGQTGILVPGEKNKPVFRPVTIGPSIENQTQILQGVQAGERVFVGLPEGQKLEDIVKDKK